jgi:hypothetical protein
MERMMVDATRSLTESPILMLSAYLTSPTLT